MTFRHAARGAAALAALAAVALTTLISPASARAMVMARSFEQMVGTADAVVLARATGQRSYAVPDADPANNRLPVYTDVRFQVLQVLKGSRPQTLSLTNPGGTIPGATVRVSEAARFRTGETYLLILDTFDEVIGARYGAYDVAGGRVPRLSQDWETVRGRIGREVGHSSAAVAGIPDDSAEASGSLSAAAVPAIASMSPSRVPAGVPTQTVTISGSGFGTAAGSVTFPQTNGDPPRGSIMSWTDTSIVVGVPAGADSGNVVVTTSDAQVSAPYAYQVGYSFNGHRTAGPSITYRINPNTADLADPATTIRAAMDIWNAVPDSNFRYLYGGASPVTLNPPSSDGTNDIYFASTGFPSGVLAWNYTYYRNGQIFDSNVIVNDAFTWVDGAVSGSFDLRSVMVHELGHTLSLDDQYGAADSTKLMYGQMAAGRTKRTLSSWDIDGIRHIYGNETPSVPDVAPTTAASVAPAAADGAAGWYRTVPAVQLTRTGAGSIAWAWDGVAYTSAPSTPFTVPVTGQGTHTLRYYGVNGGAAESPAHALTVRIDSLPPSTVSDAAGLYTASASVHLTSTDGLAGSGVAATSWTLDGVPGSGTTVSTSALGSHALAFSSIDVAGNRESTRSVSFEVTDAPVPTADVTRTGGADRYAVAASLAEQAYPGFAGTRHVVIACGSDRAMADPLSAAGLAGVYDAPILLVQNDRRVVVPADTARVLAEMRAANGSLSIHVVGGPASVTAGHVKVLSQYGAVDRVGGADRYAVASGVAARMRSVLGSAYPRTAIVTNGNLAAYFYNALAASPVADHAHYPILLVKNGSVPPATAAALKAYSNRIVVGDTGAVNAAAATAAGAGVRITGADRFAVADAVAASFTSTGELSWETVGLASMLPDALTGGATMGAAGGPILFTMPSTLPASTGDLLAAHATEISGLRIFGGPASVTSAVEEQVDARLGR